MVKYNLSSGKADTSNCDLIEDDQVKFVDFESEYNDYYAWY